MTSFFMTPDLIDKPRSIELEGFEVDLDDFKLIL